MAELDTLPLTRMVMIAAYTKKETVCDGICAAYICMDHWLSLGSEPNHGSSKRLREITML
jgi:hypothetical protein